MQHQLFGLESYTLHGAVKQRLPRRETTWDGQNLSDLFNKSSEVLATVLHEHHTNLFFTVAHSIEDRIFGKQKYVPFDIDHVDPARAEETLRAALGCLGVQFEQTLSLFSGHGVQFFIELAEAFDDPSLLDDKAFYKACCDRIDVALKAAGLPGNADTTMWCKARIMRVPNTINHKPGKDPVKCYAIGCESVPVLFDLRLASGTPTVEKKEQLVKWPSPDITAVREGCENIKLMLSDPESVSEPLWYAIGSIFFHLHNGDRNEARLLWHQYSSAAASYNASEADRKFEQAGAASGPRTCKNFSTVMGSRCSSCKYAGKLTSPIVIVGPDHISTKETGFHTVGIDAEGKPSVGKPHYEDLLKWFDRQHTFVVNAETETVFTFNGKFYEPYTDAQVKAFAEKWFTKCTTQKASEFFQKVKRNHLRPPSWWLDTTEGKMNFQNGVLDTSTMEFKEGSHRDHGFLFALSYAYDSTALAPRFSKFLEEVTGGDAETQRVLTEFGGYALSNDPYWEHKALLLVGNGRNGKSSYVEALQMVAENGHSASMLHQFNDPQFTANLEGKLFNVSDETSSRSFQDTAMFKALTSGGSIAIKRVYERPYIIKNKAKIIACVNELPLSEDNTVGFFKRMAIVPFNLELTLETRDTDLVKVKFMAERAGILNLMLNSYQNMKARKGLFVAKVGEELLEEYRRTTDHVLSWFEDFVTVAHEWDDSSPCTSNADMYASYRQYCEATGIKPTPNVLVSARLKRLVGGLGDRRTIKRVGGKTTRVWVGVSLRREGESF